MNSESPRILANRIVMKAFIIGTHNIIIMGMTKLTVICLNSSCKLTLSLSKSSSIRSGSWSNSCRVNSSFPVIITTTPMNDTISTAVLSLVSPFFKNMHENMAVNNGDKFCIKLATTKGRYLIAVYRQLM